MLKLLENLSIPTYVFTSMFLMSMDISEPETTVSKLCQVSIKEKKVDFSDDSSKQIARFHKTFMASKDIHGKKDN